VSAGGLPGLREQHRPGESVQGYDVPRGCHRHREQDKVDVAHRIEGVAEWDQLHHTAIMRLLTIATNYSNLK
jgi:hypothetical protein